MCMGVGRRIRFCWFHFPRPNECRVPALEAAIEAGYTRMRPVIMTALAMLIEWCRWRLGFGEGGEQNAPLGRAVLAGCCSRPSPPYFSCPAYLR